jgi:hypothetical protein
MSPYPVLLAATWQEQLQEYHDKVPELLDKVGIPTFEKMPELTLLGDIALVLALLVLLVAVFRLLTLRIFRFFFCVVAALLIAYYPLAYGFHYWRYQYDAAAKQERDPTDFEKKIDQNLKYIDWGIMGAGVFIGGSMFLLTFGGGRRHEYEEEDYTQEQQPAPQYQPQQSRRSRGGGGHASGKNPFDFS